MQAKLLYLWETLRNSYWFVPAMMAVGAGALAIGMVSLDLIIGYEMVEKVRWVYTGGPDGARSVLSTVAGSMITVAGVAFSITIVALALASAQFGPRLLSNFMRDTGNQIVLGTFVATFIYSLLILRTIRSGDETSAFVPYLAVTMSIVLAVMSLGVLIYFIHHASISIQAPHLIATVAHELHEGIDDLYPEAVDQGSAEHVQGELPEHFEQGSAPVPAHRGGYLDAIVLDSLMEVATDHDLLIRVEHRPGAFVVEGTPLARVFPGDRVDSAIEGRIRGAFITDFRRTPLEDIEFSVDQLVEVALRALSPALNDPFTALACIDHLGASLCQLAGRRMPAAGRFDDQRRLRLVTRYPLTFAGVVDAAFNQIRQNASFHAAVYIRMLETIEVIINYIPNEARLESLTRHANMIRTAGLQNLSEPSDCEDLEGRYSRVVQTAKQRRATLSGTSLKALG